MWQDIKESKWFKIALVLILLVLAAVSGWFILRNREAPETITETPDTNMSFQETTNQGCIAVYYTDESGEGQINLAVRPDGETVVMTAGADGYLKDEIADYSDWNEAHSNLSEYFLEDHRISLTADTEYTIPESQKLNSSIKDMPEGSNIYQLTERDSERYIRSLIGKGYTLLEFIQYNVKNTVYWEAILSAPDSKSLFRLSYSRDLIESEQGIMIEIQDTQFNSFLYPLNLNKSKGYIIE